MPRGSMLDTLWTQALCSSGAVLSSGQDVEEEELHDQMDLGGDWG